MRAKLSRSRREMAKRMHRPIPDQGRWLASVLSGHYRYYAVPDNVRRSRLPQRGRGTGSRRSGVAASATGLTWKRMARLADQMATSTARPAPLAHRSDSTPKP